MAEDHGNVHVIKDAASLDVKLKEAQNVKHFAVVEFTSSFGDLYDRFSTDFTKLSKKYENIIFLKVDIDEVRHNWEWKDIKAKWGVNDLPTYVFIMSGGIIDKATHGDKLSHLGDMIGTYSSITDFAYE